MCIVGGKDIIPPLKFQGGGQPHGWSYPGVAEPMAFAISGSKEH